MKRYESILVVSDNDAILNKIGTLILQRPDSLKDRTYDFACSSYSRDLIGRKIGEHIVKSIDVKNDFDEIINRYDLVISAHCKQIFPKELVEGCKCINIHPGYNPYNRGWYPQVFSILNNLPLGATIHEIDEQLDHGNIIDQLRVGLDNYDTSLTAYNKVQDAEFVLLEKNFESIVNGTYDTFSPDSEGNINLKKDYNSLLEIDLDESMTMGRAIDKLRALTHPPYENAYFIDKATGKKIFIRIEMHPE